MFVYFAINSVNLKVYIGKSVDPHKRWAVHIAAAVNRGCDFAFHRAIRKYGAESFHFAILEECKSDEESYARETYWIQVYDTLVDNGKGYNLTKGGDGLGLKTSGTEAKRIQNLTLALQTPESRDKRSAITKALWENPDYRSKTQEAAAEGCRRPEVRELHRSLTTKRLERLEAKASLLAASQKSHACPEIRAKRAKALSKTLQSPEAKGRLSATFTKMWENPEYRASKIKELTVAANTPERKEINRQTLRARYETPERLEINEAIIELYLLGAAPKEIGEWVGCHWGTVYSHIKKYNEKS